jgi:diguanylate cyclase (GGDEF)-like protein
MTPVVSTLRSVPTPGTEATRRLDARAVGATTLLFTLVGLPWTWIQPTLLNLVTSVVGAAAGSLLLIRPPRLPAWTLAGTTALTGVAAAYLTLVVQAMSLAAALSVCVVLQVSALRSRRQAWTQLALMVLVWCAALLRASVPDALLRSMLPLVAVLVLLTAMTTWARHYVDELLRQLHHRADHDLLTGLLNRQGLERRLHELGLAQGLRRRATDAPAGAERAMVGSSTAGRSTVERLRPVAPAPALPVATPTSSTSAVAAGIGAHQAPTEGESMTRESMGVLVIDVDHFKVVNDQHGHLAGDEALMWLAALLRGALPTPTVLARFGGEEFLAVLPGIEEAALLRCAEQVRALVATTSTSRPVRLTVSIGTAVGCVGSEDASEPPGPTFEDLVACADRGVYAAKAGGRNRVNPGSWSTSSAADAESALDTSHDLQKFPRG